jgi:serine/threonine-protein kinase
MSATKARATLGDAKLSVPQPSYTHSSTVPKNHVISQDPAANEYVDEGTDVTLTLSLGKQSSTVPYLIGQTRDQATAALAAAKLQGAFHNEESDQPKGTVIRTDPPPNSPVPQGSTVNVFLSKGPQKVPDVVGMQQADAEKTLRDHGFVPVPVSQPSSKPEGEVIQQVPNAGQPESQGTQVTIVVSSGPTESPSSPTTTPTSPTTSLPTSPPTTSSSAKPPGPGGGPG